VFLPAVVKGLMVFVVMLLGIMGTEKKSNIKENAVKKKQTLLKNVFFIIYMQITICYVM
jgi:hypothetical protein